MERTALLCAALVPLGALAQLGPEQRFVYPVQAWSVAIADVDTDGDADALQVQGDHLYVHEQLSPGEFRVNYDLGATGRADRLRSADLDGDGIDDLLMPRFDADAVSWIRVLGGGNFGVLQDLVTGVDGVFDAQAADLDGDADLDLLYAYMPTSVDVAWSENQGGGVFGPPVMLVNSAINDLIPEHASRFDTGDIDNDGDMDILLRDAGGLSWLDNDGSGNFTANAIPGVTGADVQLANVNSDAFPDILFPFLGGIQMRLNDGNGGFFAAQPAGLVFLNGDIAFRLMAIDMDNDGDDDLAFRETGPVSVTDMVAVALNNGGTFSYVTMFALPSDTPQPFAVGDLNGAGPMDVFGKANHGLFMVPDAGTVHVRLTSVATPMHVTAADTDGDGDNDVVLSGTTIFGPITTEGYRPLQLGVHLNNAVGDMAETPLDVWVGASGIRRADATDTDGDGDQDLVAVWQEGDVGTYKQYMALENLAGVFDSVGTIGAQFFTQLLSDPMQPWLRDIDGDADIDLVRHNGYGIARCANDGSGVFGPESAFGPGGMWIPSAVTLCDLDSDALPDYIWSHGNFPGSGPDSVFLNENLGLGVPGPNQFLGFAPVHPYADNVSVHSPIMRGTDVNADGLEDLLIFNGDSLGVMLNTGGGLATSQAWSCGAIAYALGDMDQNGYTDIVALRTNSNIVAYLNSPNGFGWGQLMASAPQSTGTSHIALADMDGDLDLDVITCSEVGSAAWLGNLGNFPLGVPETIVETKVDVFPNPNNGSFTVRSQKPITQVRFVDAQGRNLGQFPGYGASAVSLAQPNAGPGLYFLHTMHDDGSQTVGKVMIE